ncbi:MAG TPA: PLDc N-terminal domain-containing protein [Panacibacter sp.]|nr:PLDc N-terminal domain-containing protein [Panacibacter sp.]
MGFLSNNFYYITIILQVICVVHCLKKGKQTMWIWLIIFLPLIGCIAYIFMEMFKSSDLQKVQSGVGSVLNPNGNITKLEEQLRFSDTFNNRVSLADAYLSADHVDKAIALYESSLTGAFTENEHVLTQLIIAYFQKQRYQELISIANKVYKLPQFPRSKAHLLYAMALENTGSKEMAEQEFKKMKSRYSDFEARYQYGLFLIRAGRKEEARQLFTDMCGEVPHLGSHEKKFSRNWINLAKEELKKMAI